MTNDQSTYRVWTVRAGTDGMGLDLFHVYAPGMDSARVIAKSNAEAAGFIFGDNFTVHGIREWDHEEPWYVRLGNNIVTDRPAIDYTEEMIMGETWHGVSHDDMDATADASADRSFFAVLSEITESIESGSPRIVK